MASGFWRLKMLAAASVAALLAACATPPPTPEELEAQAWATAQTQDSPLAYDEYLRLYGDWPNAENARLRAELEQSRDLIIEMSKHCNATALVADWLERNT